MIGDSMAHSTSAEAPSSVVAAGVAGDVTLMWAEFAARLRAFVARRVPAGIEPDDVVQEVFLRVVRHLPSLRDAERIEAWLFQIARNALRDAMRARQRRDSRTDALEVDVPAEADVDDMRAAETELAPCLTPMVARLAEPYRSAIELTSLQGLTQTDAAKRVGVSVSGMKSRVQRAREQLKVMLLRCCEVDVGRRRGVSDYHVRESALCGNPSDGSASARGCGTAGCPPRQ
jgi:RNA polymerase sigma-70 factor (ECF subfamily)